MTKRILKLPQGFAINCDSVFLERGVTLAHLAQVLLSPIIEIGDINPQSTETQEG